ncbi:hypothetical protein GW17_00037634 [Ensete ventricosum]|nr:hypothetical protein GW17_00037634 [Ensete ventricosum]RZS03277.1 hypothetical protein BHM03_00033442 [Ensete ventricosum]
MDLTDVSEELAHIEGQISDIFRALSNGFQKLEKIKDSNRRSRQLEELTGKLRECKRYILGIVISLTSAYLEPALKMKNWPDFCCEPFLIVLYEYNIKELNSYVALKKQ